MSPTKEAIEYRRLAAECLIQAAATDDPGLRIYWLALAESWKELAGKDAEDTPPKDAEKP